MEEKDENSYEEVKERLDTLGGYFLAITTGPVNVPATIVGLSVDYLTEERETSGETLIEITEEGSDRNDNISSKSQEETQIEGGEIEMTEDTEYFQSQGREVLDEEDEFYDLLEEGPGYVQEAAGLAQEVRLAEAGESDYTVEELAEYAVTKGMEDAVGALKTRIVIEEAGMEELYDEFVEQVYDRAADVTTASWMQEQLQELTRGMSEGTRRAAAAHEATESAFEYGRETAEESADAVMATLQNLESARTHKGLESVDEELEEETTEE